VLSVAFLALLTTGVGSQAPTFTQVGVFKAPADTVEIKGTHAYIAGGKTITIVDVSNPAAPKQLSVYNFPEQIWSFRVSGSNLYVAANFFGLGVLDVSDPERPRLRASIKTPGQAKATAVIGDKVLVADHNSGIDIIDLSTMEKPKYVGSFFVDGYARDVAAHGAFGYAVDAPTGLYVLDPSKPEDAVGQLQSAATPQAVEVLDMGAGQPPIVCVIGAGMLQLYDVSKPSTPVRIGTLKTPGRAGRVTFTGKVAYVADGREGVQVVDLSVPAKPTIVGTVKTPVPVRDVAIEGSLLVVTAGVGEGNEQILIFKE
jgi:hypothetical protein